MKDHPDFTRLARAERIANRRDNAFRLPGTRITVGWDSIVGLVPGIGDALALLPGIYILQAAQAAGAPRSLILRMASNMGIDWVIGLIPLIGDVFDVGFKSNLRNVALLRAHVEARHREAGQGGNDPRPFDRNGAPPSPGDRPARDRLRPA